jgi:hypothetical protein
MPEKIDLSRYDKVTLKRVDCSNNNEIIFKDGACVNLSGSGGFHGVVDFSNLACIDLTNTNLSGATKVKFGEGEVILGKEVKLPKNIDVSKVRVLNVDKFNLEVFDELDLSNIEKIVVNKEISAPKKIRLSKNNEYVCEALGGKNTIFKICKDGDFKFCADTVVPCRLDLSEHDEVDFGNADLSNFEFGDSRNWCLANGLGGYSSQSIINSSNRKHHGYLIASLNSPVQRYLILNKINEKVFNNNIIYNLESQQYKDHIKEGYKYLHSFTFDTTPIYKYLINGIEIIKEISPDYGHNTVGISYIIKNNSSNSKIELNPIFNYKDHGEAIDVDSIKFKEKYCDNKVILTPKINEKLKIKFYYSEGNLALNDNKIISDYYCNFDQSTGD